MEPTTDSQISNATGLESLFSAPRSHLIPENSENLHLADFIDIPGSDCRERAAIFSAVIRKYTEGESAVWTRENVGASSSSISIRSTGDLARREVMFGSNNYLGFATDPYVIEAVKAAVDQYGVGAGGPPLLNGMMTIHRTLERRLAELKGAEDCLLFASGYQANLGWVDAFLRKGDILFYDEQSHASLFDGVAMTSSMRRYRAFRFRHNDVDHLASLLENASKTPEQKIFVAVEGVYSMCGDLAPLKEIQALCREYGAFWVVDDAHGTGVMGKNGEGTVEHFNLDQGPDLSMGTFSKAFGTTGGFIAGDRALIDYMRFFARSYMFSAHLPPPVVATVLAGLDLMELEPERIRQLHANVQYFVKRLNDLGIEAETKSAIVAISVPQDVPIRLLTMAFHHHGVFLNCVEYPAVSKGNQRLRLSIMATHSQDDLDHVLDVFKLLDQEFHFIRTQASLITGGIESEA